MTAHCWDGTVESGVRATALCGQCAETGKPPYMSNAHYVYEVTYFKWRMESTRIPHAESICSACALLVAAVGGPDGTNERKV